MKSKIYAKIEYKIKKNHPDIKYVKDWSKDKIYEFDDTYYIDNDYFYCEDQIKSYIKHDMELVAGGGYDTKGIEIVNYETRRV